MYIFVSNIVNYLKPKLCIQMCVCSMDKPFNLPGKWGVNGNGLFPKINILNLEKKKYGKEKC